MNVVDSSGWLEYFADGENADFFSRPIYDRRRLIVPVLSIAEVFGAILEQRNEGDALQAIAAMQQGRVVDLTPSLALEAARLRRELRIPMAGGIVLATARAYDAVLWTQERDFEAIEGVKFIKRAG